MTEHVATEDFACKMWTDNDNGQNKIKLHGENEEERKEVKGEEFEGRWARELLLDSAKEHQEEEEKEGVGGGGGGGGGRFSLPSPAAEEDGSYVAERGPRERSEGGWVTQEVPAAKLWGWERSAGFLHADSLCSTVIVAWARIQVDAGFWCRSLRRGSLLARHS